MASNSVDTMLANLKVLSGIRTNEKLLVGGCGSNPNIMTVDRTVVLQSAQRWAYRQGRDRTQQAISSLVSDLKEQSRLQMDGKTADMALLKRMVDDGRNAVKGIEMIIKTTYEGDEAIKALLQVSVQNLQNHIVNIEEFLEEHKKTNKKHTTTPCGGTQQPIPHHQQRRPSGESSLGRGVSSECGGGENMATTTTAPEQQTSKQPRPVAQHSTDSPHHCHYDGGVTPPITENAGRHTDTPSSQQHTDTPSAQQHTGTQPNNDPPKQHAEEPVVLSLGEGEGDDGYSSDGQ
jgi:hypothetical protein